LNKGRVHFVVVFNLTRFARDKYDHFALRSHLKSLGISLRSATVPIDDTSTGKLMDGVLAAFAQFDNDVRSDRTRAGMKAALELTASVSPSCRKSKPPRIWQTERWSGCWKTGARRFLVSSCTTRAGDSTQPRSPHLSRRCASESRGSTVGLQLRVPILGSAGSDCRR
jgi:Resolvase, N terminal domain